MKSRDRLLVLVGLFLATLVLWDTPLVYPLKVLVVFFHELSHAMAAMLTGGEVSRITLSPDLGGVTWTRGGWRLAILPAGYLGSMAWGALLVLGAAWTTRDRQISLALGVFLLLVTVVYVRSLFGFGCGLLFSGLLIVSGLRLSEGFNDLLLSFVGLTSMLYALLDIRDDLISRTVAESDASQFAQLIPLPPVVWGVLWGVVAVVFAGWVLHLAVKEKS